MGEALRSLDAQAPADGRIPAFAGNPNKRFGPPTSRFLRKLSDVILLDFAAGWGAIRMVAR